MPNFNTFQGLAKDYLAERYPYAGCRHAPTGYLEWIDVYGFLWSTEVIDNKAWNMRSYVTAGMLSNADGRGHAMSVRCVQE